ncbi:hypothetical protein [Actinoplanes sp. GCM10030250]|uniref:hypothetical protein n=1 Tax=Actinoplanes sp. GCM10030250 TaxID=3273376 RepID=UPI00361FC484
MEFEPQRRPDELIRSSRDELLRALRRRPLPVAVLAGMHTLPPGRLGGWESWNGAVSNVSVTYGAADVPGSWVTVETARWGGTTISAGPLREALEHHMRIRQDRSSAVEWFGEDGAVTVDGRTVAGHLLRAGDRWWALRCSLRDLEITVVAHDWHSSVALRTIADPELHELTSIVPAPPAWQPAPPAEPREIQGEPHRLLVDEVLRSDRERAAWMTDGGPAPRSPENWPALWRAAILRQADLADQPESEAQRTIQVMIDQLTNLQHQAAWFRDQEGLRELAISETLLFTTGLSPNVPSRVAQMAWLRRQGSQPGAHAHARIESLAAARTHWLDAWQTWVRLHNI